MRNSDRHWQATFRYRRLVYLRKEAYILRNVFSTRELAADWAGNPEWRYRGYTFSWYRSIIFSRYRICNDAIIDNLIVNWNKYIT